MYKPPLLYFVITAAFRFETLPKINFIWGMDAFLFLKQKHGVVKVLLLLEDMFSMFGVVVVVVVKSIFYFKIY